MADVADSEATAAVVVVDVVVVADLAIVGDAEEDAAAVVDSVVVIVALETVGADGDAAVLLAVVPALAASLRSKVRRLPLTNCASMFVSLYLLACSHSFIYLL